MKEQYTAIYTLLFTIAASVLALSFFVGKLEKGNGQGADS